MSDLVINTADLSLGASEEQGLIETVDVNGTPTVGRVNGTLMIERVQFTTDPETGETTVDLPATETVSPAGVYFRATIGRYSKIFAKGADSENLATVAAVVAPQPLPNALELGGLGDVDTSGAAAGQALVFDDETGQWVAGEGGGTVDSVAGAGIVSVDDSDPANPVIEVDTSGLATTSALSALADSIPDTPVGGDASGTVSNLTIDVEALPGLADFPVGSSPVPSGVHVAGVEVGGTVLYPIADVASKVAALLPAGSVANTALATNPLARANHTGTQTASTISNFDTQVRTSRIDQMAAPTSTLTWTGSALTAASLSASSGTATDGLVQAAASSLFFGGGIIGIKSNTGSATFRTNLNVNGLGIGNGTDGPDVTLERTGTGAATFLGAFRLNGNVGFYNTAPISKRTGYTTAPTGTLTRTTFATSTVTLSELAERVAALLVDLRAYGLIGA